MKSVKRQWDRVLPYRGQVEASPIFLYELRRLRLQRFNTNLSQYGATAIVGILALALGWWLLERLHIGFTNIDAPWQYNLINLIFLISIPFTLFSSFANTMTMINSTQYHIDSGQWESLRLTPQSYNFNLVTSYIAIGQIRAWRFTIIEMALRFATVILFLFNVLYSVCFIVRPGNPDLSWIDWLIIGLGIGGLIAGAYILEPLFRMRLLVAFSMAITLRFTNLINAILTGLGVVALLHLLQFGGFLTLWYLAIPLPPPDDWLPLGLICAVPIGSLIGTAIFVYLYRSIEDRAESYLWDLGFLH